MLNLGHFLRKFEAYFDQKSPKMVKNGQKWPIFLVNYSPGMSRVILVRILVARVAALGFLTFSRESLGSSSRTRSDFGYNPWLLNYLKLMCITSTKKAHLWESILKVAGSKSENPRFFPGTSRNFRGLFQKVGFSTFSFWSGQTRTKMKSLKLSFWSNLVWI